MFQLLFADLGFGFILLFFISLMLMKEFPYAQHSLCYGGRERCNMQAKRDWVKLSLNHMQTLMNGTLKCQYFRQAHRAWLGDFCVCSIAVSAGNIFKVIDIMIKENRGFFQLYFFEWITLPLFVKGYWDWVP